MILKDEIINKILVIRKNRAVSMAKKVPSQLKNYDAKKNKKKSEVLLEVIQRVYNKNPEMQEVIDASKR